ncbi:regulatory protein RecX [Thalassolituus sp.]|uniref:regulatory protein RecX n=1 Tax=Thalassolituus sp. TaxID=2030822 RepID=UPI0027D71217|nr:regulatory protein RecX [Thalassolituus sp.]MDQ4427334.1 regulatory protein RecX [Thalassolituus sp.]
MKKPKPEPLDQSGLKHAAVDLLSRRDYSRRELWRKLSPKAASADDLECVLDELAERQWQSDERFASMFVRSRASRGVGPVRLKQELREKGVDGETACSAFETSEENWHEKALEVARRKARSIGHDNPDFKLKLWRFLSYRGFSSDQISSAIDTLLHESSE